MNQTEVKLSRMAAQVVDLLNLEYRLKFTDAVVRARSVSSVADPYRGWILDPSSVPEEARRSIPINLR